MSLQSEVIPDLMDAEQTWPTEEELAEAEQGKVYISFLPFDCVCLSMKLKCSLFVL